MNVEKLNFLAQPVVKNIYVYRNGDPYYEARRLVINEKRVGTFETLLREVTGGVRAPFGAVRNIYTPTGGRRVESLEHVQHGEQYVAAGREKFKKLDYLQIGNKKKKMQQANGTVKPVPQSRIIVSPRFLKPIKEPCAIFVVANGDVLNPAVRFLVPNRVLGQFERILEMITEKIGLRILGGVRSLYTFDGVAVTDGKDLENGQFYVAVGRDKFKRLPYADLLFSKPTGMRRVIRSKAASLPPIYTYRRQNGYPGNRVSKSTAGCGDSGENKSSPLTQSTKEPLATLVREISQARLMTIRKKRSGLTVSLSTQDNEDGDQKPEEVNEESEESKEGEETGEEQENGEGQEKGENEEKPLEEEPSADDQSQETAGEDEALESDEAAPTAEEPATTEEDEEEKGGDEEEEEEKTGEEETTTAGEEEVAGQEEEEEVVVADEGAGGEEGQADESAGEGEGEAAEG